VNPARIVVDTNILFKLKAGLRAKGFDRFLEP
jgi:hypothetical protein